MVVPGLCMFESGPYLEREVGGSMHRLLSLPIKRAHKLPTRWWVVACEYRHECPLSDY